MNYANPIDLASAVLSKAHKNVVVVAPADLAQHLPLILLKPGVADRSIVDEQAQISVTIYSNAPLPGEKSGANQLLEDCLKACQSSDYHDTEAGFIDLIKVDQIVRAQPLTDRIDIASFLLVLTHRPQF